MNRAIVHMDLDTFFVSCERLKNSALNGLPLIIGGSSDRGVVSSCSYEARYFGVRSAMPMRMALRLCPQAKVIKGDMEMYSNQSRLITDIIREQAPVFEKSSIDEFYIDVTGMDRFFGTYKWTKELADLVMKESGLPLSFGLSVNKTVAKIATGEAKPLGKIHIAGNGVQPFLFPLSIRKIPGVGKETHNLLFRVGVRRIQTLAEMPAAFMQDLIGHHGLSLWRKANGIDPAPVIPFRERKSVSTEQTFEKDTIDVVKLEAIMISMVEKLGFQLRKEGWLSGCIAVKIRYSNFDTHTRQKRIKYTASDHELIRFAKDLFRQVYDRRMLVRLIGVRMSELIHGSYQIDLFNDTEEEIALYEAIDKMKRKYGALAVRRAAGR